MVCIDFKAFPKQPATCAVVFDSGYLARHLTVGGTSLAANIDAHTYVWRINTRPYALLGHQTTTMVASFGHENPSARLLQPDARRLWPNLTAIVTFESYYSSPRTYRDLCNRTRVPWYFVPQKFRVPCAQWTGGVKCSSGALSVLLALQTCRAVRLYGGNEEAALKKWTSSCPPYRFDSKRVVVNDVSESSTKSVNCSNRRSRRHDLSSEHEFYTRMSNFRVVV